MSPETADGARHLTLTQHDADGERSDVEGFPRIGPAAVDALRRRCFDRVDLPGGPVRWWHTDGATAWAAVTAGEVAQLLDTHGVGFADDPHTLAAARAAVAAATDPTGGAP